MKVYNLQEDPSEIPLTSPLPPVLTVRGHTRRVLGVSSRPNHPEEVASVSDDLLVRITNAETDSTRLTTTRVPGLDRGIEDVQFSPNGEQVAYVGKTSSELYANVWVRGASTGEVLNSWSHDLEAFHVSYSPDSRLIMST